MCNTKTRLLQQNAVPEKFYADTTKAMKEFGNTLQQIKSVLNDTAFAAEVVKPVTIKDSVATKKTCRDENK
jgi:hypothetical protein